MKTVFWAYMKDVFRNQSFHRGWHLVTNNKILYYNNSGQWTVSSNHEFIGSSRFVINFERIKIGS